MKKLAIIISLAVSATAFACPNMDHDAAQTTTAKADKADQNKTKAPAAKETKDAPKTDTAKATPAKEKSTEKKPDKVSSN